MAKSENKKEGLIVEDTLATKYRPKTWEDVMEQNTVKTILENQINTNTIKHTYLFCGGAGTGKTTIARIFANKINNNQPFVKFDYYQ